MKKLTTIFGITLLSAVLALPILGWANGWGMGAGNHMRGGAGPGSYDRYDGGYGRMSTEQRDRWDERVVSDETETGNITPDNRFGGDYGYGRHMGGYGMGNGPGSCQN